MLRCSARKRRGAGELRRVMINASSDPCAPVARRNPDARQGAGVAPRMDQTCTDGSPRPACDDDLETAIRAHLDAAQEAASRHGRFRSGWRIERAISNLDAAEAEMLQFACAEYLLGQLRPGSRSSGTHSSSSRRWSTWRRRRSAERRAWRRQESRGDEEHLNAHDRRCQRAGRREQRRQPRVRERRRRAGRGAARPGGTVAARAGL